MGATTRQTPGGVCAATASVFAETIGRSIANIGPTLTPDIKIISRGGPWRELLPGFPTLSWPLILAYSRTLSARRIVLRKMRK